ncbi:MAG: type II secretion system protein [Phycisphaeraceae bacterium]
MLVKSRRGFSLIELLVVISIIALLIALLLPALIRSRDSVQDMTCLSNMSQLMKAQASYALEHDNLFPHYQEWIWGKSSAPPGWTGSFAVPANDYTTSLSPEYGVLNSYVSTLEAHLCPSASEMPVNGLKFGSPQGDEVVRSYVQNSHVYPGGKYPSFETVNLPEKLMILTEENTFIMKFSKAFQHPMNDGKLDMGWDSIGSIHQRKDRDNLRSGYASGAFADGHAEWVFSQSKENNVWATNAFADDTVDNPTDMDTSLIDTSMDFTFTY